MSHRGPVEILLGLLSRHPEIARFLLRAGSGVRPRVQAARGLGLGEPASC